MRALSYFFDEALASLMRGYKTALVAVVTIAAGLLVLGGFLLVTSNLQRLFVRWQEAAEFSVYLRDEVTSDQEQAVSSTLRESHLVTAVEVVSKAEALRRFKHNFEGLGAAASDLPENPLPSSIEVRLTPAANPADVQLLAERAARMDGVADVRYDRQWIQRLINAVTLFRIAGFALAIVLICAAALTVASVVRLALLARREEIHIMQLVGAPLAYIRGPFVMEGLIQGGVGAAVALGLLWALFTAIRRRGVTMMAGAIDPSSVSFLSLPLCAALLLGGVVVGCIGGLIAALNTREIGA
jgi:cell division transport system permease protein